jgi:hypothetical protein
LRPCVTVRERSAGMVLPLFLVELGVSLIREPTAIGLSRRVRRRTGSVSSYQNGSRGVGAPLGEKRGVGEALVRWPEGDGVDTDWGWAPVHSPGARNLFVRTGK